MQKLCRTVTDLDNIDVCIFTSKGLMFAFSDLFAEFTRFINVTSEL